MVALTSITLSRSLNHSIRPGHKNMISLSATKITASEEIRSLPPEQRKCLFPDENQMLEMHKSYTQSNCFLECYLFNAQTILASQHNMTHNCTPWFLPLQEHSKEFCDPWEYLKLYEIMFQNDSEGMCSQCLPDCTTVNYHPTLMAVPFR